jgi:hypothetical protein
MLQDTRQIWKKPENKPTPIPPNEIKHGHFSIRNTLRRDVDIALVSYLFSFRLMVNLPTTSF